jgi:hypothetical protein
LSKYQELLTQFDPIGINRYHITARDLEEVEKYIRILQSPVFQATVWDDAICIGGEYGTSIIIHEVVQIRGLRRIGIDPLQLERAELQKALAEHIEVHAIAVYEEHLYLQEVLVRMYGQRFEVATLVRANREDERDLSYFRDSDIGLFFFEEDRVEEVREWLCRLRQGRLTGND